ncbi:hypothetical protein Fcan01_08109 [Folsomia candida]|uniref:Uncharacterized protein n=2 Tax=Folsomia candida TaxID=158441 RepID=A0A226EM98_FOLCA|nr:hypothetical protein Fcan01_08109 [Folsomia candida]
MRNENLELAQSSGSDSSPSWGLDSNSARVSNFTFDLGPTKTIDDLTTRFTSTLRSTKSSEVLSETSEEKSTASTSTTSSHNYHHLFPSTSKRCFKYGSGERISGDSVSAGPSSSVSADDKKVAKESKIAKFLRRTQSAHDDKQCAGGGPKFGGECSKEPLQKIDDTDEETQTRKRNK